MNFKPLNNLTEYYTDQNVLLHTLLCQPVKLM